MYQALPPEVAFYHNQFLDYLRHAAPQSQATTSAVTKLSRFSELHLIELSMDIYDELQRRLDSQAAAHHLLPREDIHPKRNHARFQIGELSIHRFCDMCQDLIAEHERRWPELRNAAIRDQKAASIVMPPTSESIGSDPTHSYTLPSPIENGDGSFEHLNKSTSSSLTGRSIGKDEKPYSADESEISLLRIQNVSSSSVNPTRTEMVEDSDEDVESVREEDMDNSATDDFDESDTGSIYAAEPNNDTEMEKQLSPLLEKGHPLSEKSKAAESISGDVLQPALNLTSETESRAEPRDDPSIDEINDPLPTAMDNSHIPEVSYDEPGPVSELSSVPKPLPEPKAKRGSKSIHFEPEAQPPLTNEVTKKIARIQNIEPTSTTVAEELSGDDDDDDDDEEEEEVKPEHSEKLIALQEQNSHLKQEVTKLQQTIRELAQKISEGNEKETANQRRCAALQTKLQDTTEELAKAVQRADELSVKDRTANAAPRVVDEPSDVVPRETYDQLMLKHTQLGDKLTEQRRVTEKVRNEASLFLEEMRQLTQREPGDTTVVERLAAEVKMWKCRYSSAVATGNPRKNGEMSISTDLSKIDEKIWSQDGLVREADYKHFCATVRVLLVGVRGEPHGILPLLHNVVMATWQVAPSNVCNASGEPDSLGERRSFVKKAANQLISVCRNHSVSNGLLPSILIDAAVSDLCMSIVSYVQAAGLRPDPEERKQDNESTQNDIQNGIGIQGPHDRVEPQVYSLKHNQDIPRLPGNFAPESDSKISNLEQDNKLHLSLSPSSNKIPEKSPTEILSAPDSYNKSEFSSNSPTRVQSNPARDLDGHTSPAGSRASAIPVAKHELKTVSTGPNTTVSSPKPAQSPRPLPQIPQQVPSQTNQDRYSATPARYRGQGGANRSRSQSPIKAPAAITSSGTSYVTEDNSKTASPAVDINRPKLDSNESPLNGKRHIVPPVESPATAETETSPPISRDDDSKQRKRQPVVSHRQPEIPADSSIEELQGYLEEKTSGTVDSIGALLSGIRDNATANELKPNIRTIVASVDHMINATNTAMKQSRNWLLKDKGAFIVDNLNDCLDRMDNLQEELTKIRGDAKPPRQLKQRLAGVSFDMAKSTKELVKTVEEVSLKNELAALEHQLQ